MARRDRGIAGTGIAGPLAPLCGRLQGQAESQRLLGALGDQRAEGCGASQPVDGGAPADRG